MCVKFESIEKRYEALERKFDYVTEALMELTEKLKNVKNDFIPINVEKNFALPAIPFNDIERFNIFENNLKNSAYANQMVRIYFTLKKSNMCFLKLSKQIFSPTKSKMTKFSTLCVSVNMSSWYCTVLS